MCIYLYIAKVVERLDRFTSATGFIIITCTVNYATRKHNRYAVVPKDYSAYTHKKTNWPPWYLNQYRTRSVIDSSPGVLGHHFERKHSPGINFVTLFF